MSGMRAAGGLRDIFGETPPLDDDGDSPCPIIPAIWQDLIQEAQDLGILDEDAAARWGRAFARQARQNAEDEEAYYADFRQSILDDDDISENNIVKRILRGESVNEHSREDDRSDNDQDRHGTGKSIEDREHDLR
ncbi:hypothetical protein SEUCBS140593_003175 [Sporothrix eucalyptigena]|uniref:Uncharacterized protein n=1 Tax=Sporothrix eucalyptigena TaxID=1812306 RepID=A0ABP0BDQ8_9PEZI